MTVCLRAKTLKAKTGKDIGAQFSNMHQYHIRAKETPVVVVVGDPALIIF